MTLFTAVEAATRSISEISARGAITIEWAALVPTGSSIRSSSVIEASSVSKVPAFSAGELNSNFLSCNRLVVHGVDCVFCLSGGGEIDEGEGDCIFALDVDLSNRPVLIESLTEIVFSGAGTEVGDIDLVRLGEFSGSVLVHVSNINYDSLNIPRTRGARD